jgi:nucleoid-associated protein YgaU
MSHGRRNPAGDGGKDMSLWNFAKSVGAKLFGASEAKAADADTLRKEAEKHGLDMSGVELKVEGDKVVLSGKALSTEEAEKIVLAIGNTTGVAAVENNVQVAKAAPESRTYEVKRGDTLWKIAEEMYGKGKGAQHTVIFEANKPMLSHPDKIYPGQVLRVPPLD